MSFITFPFPNLGCQWDSAGRPKAEYVGESGGIAAGVFLEAYGQALQEKLSPAGLRLQPQAKYSKFHPKLQNLASYDNASMHLR